jgi:hypothetical protein
MSAPKASISITQMSAASAVDSISTGRNRYGTLRMEFETAYKKMMDTSREFNSVLMTVPAGLSAEERQVRKENAARAYEEAHERFMAAVAKLHEYMIGHIISSRAALQPVANRYHTSA